jgi:hypothetical protein
MTEGMKIIMLNEHDRTLDAMGQRLTALEDEIKTIREIMKSPISRSVYAAKHGKETP